MANGVFPSLTELLIPNLNLFTILGVIAFILAVISFFPQVKAILRALNIGQMQFALISVILGLVFIWGISIVQDFLSSTGGLLVFWLTVVTAIIYLVRFGVPKKK